MINISKFYVCNLCDYGWKTKKDFGSPSVCPNCKTKDIFAYINTYDGEQLLKIEKKRRKFWDSICKGLFYIGLGVSFYALFMNLWFGIFSAIITYFSYKNAISWDYNEDYIK